MAYERHHHPPVPRAVFIRRVLAHFAAAMALLAVSMGMGMAGYSHYEALPWRDAFLNAAMLLGGMGPVDAPKTDGGKVFAGAFALYAGLVFIAGLGIMLAPFLHRMMHVFHWKNPKPQ